MRVKVTRVVVGQVLHVFASTEKDEAFIDNAVAKLIGSLKPDGDAAVLGDRTIWVEDIPIIDTGKKGSEQYRWDSSGNKVLCQRVQKTKVCGRYSDAIDSVVLRTVWKKFC